MPPIDRISINRPEPDQSLTELRKRELARRHEIKMRGTTRLLLSSIDEQSQLSEKNSHNAKSYEKDVRAQHFSDDSKMLVSSAEDNELLNLANKSAWSALHAATKTPPAERKPKFVDRTDTAFGVADGKRPLTGKQATSKAEVLDGLSLEDINDKATYSEELPPSGAETSASVGVLDNFLEKIQALASRSENSEDDLIIAITQFNNAAAAHGKEHPDYIHGIYSFLTAFFESRENGEVSQAPVLNSLYQALAKLVPDFENPDRYNGSDTNEKVKALGDEENSRPEKYTANLMEIREKADTTQDRQLLFDYIEALSSAVTLSIPAAIQTLAEVRQRLPEVALKRLVSSGDPAVAIYTKEISSKFQRIDERLKQDSSNSVRVGILRSAINLEKDHMDYSLKSAEKSTSYSAVQKKYQREENERILGLTLPQIVFRKA